MWKHIAVKLFQVLFLCDDADIQELMEQTIHSLTLINRLYEGHPFMRNFARREKLSLGVTKLPIFWYTVVSAYN